MCTGYRGKKGGRFQGQINLESPGFKRGLLPDFSEPLRVTFTEHLLYARHYAKCFTYITLFLYSAISLLAYILLDCKLLEDRSSFVD